MAMAIIASIGCVVLSQLPGAATPLWAFATVLVLAFSVADHLRGIRACIALVLILAATFTIQVGTSTSTVEMLLTPPIIVGAPALAGWLLARSRAQSERLRWLTAELAAEREKHAALAAEAERSRIARDLHDILAHTLSSIAVQAGAAQASLSASDPAMGPVEHVMTSAREGLAEVRSLLAVARGRTGPDADPRPGLERLPELTAADGASLTVVGSPVPVAAGVSLAAFRIVQEALTNARRHAPGSRPRVTVAYEPEALRIVIENEIRADISSHDRGNVDGAGNGLVGMVERAAAHSGTVQAGQSNDGELWRVCATLPYGQPESSSQPPSRESSPASSTVPSGTVASAKAAP
ncbi:sensor histidine kinase [Microbacterium elymi]|uniref:histidine kinase n=1 Tax=Microbacterium elymi TaxID=2909587 RepID=A0ABY5NIC4_9MICO|nr:histidine kinase [Microbacterium elymi]UUT34908.1 histidine kinase [Microbacterium elymi]